MTNQSGRMKFSLAIGVLASSVYFCLASESLPHPKIPLLAVCLPGRLDDAPPLVAAFRSGLKEGDLTVGTDLTIDSHYGDARVNTYARIAKTLVTLKPDVIVAASTPAIEAILRETKTIPIVMAAARDPVGFRLVCTLSQPDDNVTDLSMRSPEVSGKRLESIQELVPQARRIKILSNPTNSSYPLTVKDSRAAARALNLELQTIALQKPSGLESAFRSFLAIKAAKQIGLTIPPEMLALADQLIE